MHKKIENSPRQIRPCLVLIFFWEIDTVALSFVFDKYCPIMD